MISAVIFDLDGTIVDNEPIWETAFQAVINNYQLTVNQLLKQPNGWLHEPGIGLVNNWKRYIDGPVEQMVQQTVKEYRKICPDLNLRTGVIEAVQKAKELGRQTALCTGSTWHVVEKELGEMEMYLAFDVTVTGEEVLMSKPDPEIYILTAQKLGEEPENCVVIEDAVAGVRAAKEAGMKCIGLASDYAPTALLESAGADFVVSDMVSVSELLTKIE